MNKTEIAKELMERKFRERERLGREIIEIVDEFLDLGTSPWLSIDHFWGCPKSPFGWCAYHQIDDPAHDECIFCGDPQERK